MSHFLAVSFGCVATLAGYVCVLWIACSGLATSYVLSDNLIFYCVVCGVYVCFVV